MKWVFEIKSTLTNAFTKRENVQDAKVRKNGFRSYYIFQNAFILISLRKNSQEGKTAVCDIVRHDNSSKAAHVHIVVKDTR